MKMMITDAQDVPFQAGDTLKLPLSDQKLIPCTGCFGCWIKTPGRCVIKDDYATMGEELAKCEELVIVSRCTYGGFSPYVKNVLDRSIGYVLPYFETVNGEMHHKRRYDNVIKISVYFYGEEISPQEKKVAKSLVQANMTNFHGEVAAIDFYDTIDEVKEALA